MANTVSRQQTIEMVERVFDENERLRALIATADAMYAEHAAVEQERSDESYRAEFGPDHKGPHLAGPLGSKGREYVYERHRLSKDFSDMPDPRTALGQR